MMAYLLCERRMPFIPYPSPTSGGNLNTGEATLDFTATPSSTTTVVVTGQTAILTTSQVNAWMQASTTIDNDANAHLSAALFLQFVCSDLVAGTGFTIQAFSLAGELTGTYKVQFSWS